MLYYSDMMNYRCFLDQYPILKRVQVVADQLQLATYVVGGCVRDWILGRSSQDIDIVCVGSGIELATAVAASFDQAPQVVVFKRFGTAMIRGKDWQLEFVGARKESYQSNSRKPTVASGTLADDQHRRDFTINTLAICLNSACWGDLTDPFDGLGDLKRRFIRIPLAGTKTFSDDPLRMMRAVRFAVQLDMDIVPTTLVAIQQHAARIKIISQERIIAELNKIVAAANPSRGFYLLYQLDLLPRIFPELVALQGVETIQGQSHKDNFHHTLQVLDNVAKKSNNLWLRWAALLHDIAKPHTKRFDPVAGFTFHGHEDVGARLVPGIFRKMKLPMQANMAYVQKIVRLHLRPIALAQEGVTDAALRRLVYESGDDLEDLLLLCRADITSKNDAKVRRYLQNLDQVAQKVQWVEERDAIRNFHPVITGHIIMQTFGLPPGKLVGALKASIKEAILAGKIHNVYEEAYSYLLELGKMRGLQPVLNT